MNKYQTCFRDADKMMKIEENEKYVDPKKEKKPFTIFLVNPHTLHRLAWNIIVVTVFRFEYIWCDIQRKREMY